MPLIDQVTKDMAQAMKATGAKTKREAVEIAPRQVIDRGSLYRDIRKARGKLAWVGDVDALRLERT